MTTGNATTSIKDHIALPEVTLKIVNPLGIHARAASKFVKLAKTFDAEVRLRRGTSDADGKSIMSVMLLAAPVGSEVQLSVSGNDEQEALQALQHLIDTGFGEI